MDERETVTIDKDFYNELTNNYYAPKQNNDISTGLAIIITILVIAIIILIVWCYKLQATVDNLELTIKEINDIFSSFNKYFN